MAGNRGGDTRQRILEAARTVAREHGYGGTTMAMIQKAAGVHPGSLYWHFKDKDSLFTGMIQDAYESATSSYAGIATTGGIRIRCSRRCRGGSWTIRPGSDSGDSTSS